MRSSDKEDDIQQNGKYSDADDPEHDVRDKESAVFLFWFGCFRAGWFPAHSIAAVVVLQSFFTQYTTIETEKQIERNFLLKSFTDNKGRTWMLEVTVATIKRVRALCKVDLNSIVELDKNNKPSAELLERLSSDPVLLVDVLYAVCKPQADKLGITDEDFGESMAGDAIEHATTALLEEVIDFFPEAKRMVMQKILSASRKFSEAARKKLEAELNDEFENRVASELDRLTGSSGTAPESAV